MPQSEYGVIEVWDDFLGPDNDLTWGLGTVKVGNLGFVSVNASGSNLGTFEWTVDEPGGIVAITTHATDNDNAALMAGTFRPADGGIIMEARFKQADVTTGAIYCGFTETLNLATPVMPAEFATATMSYNGSGGMVGCVWDPDATTNRWKALAGDGGSVSSNASANGEDDNASGDAVNDQWEIVRVEIGPDATARIYHDEILIDTIASAITAGDKFYAVLMIENRSAAANTLEVDYFHARGYRDWSV